MASKALAADAIKFSRCVAGGRFVVPSPQRFSPFTTRPKVTGVSTTTVSVINLDQMIEGAAAIQAHIAKGGNKSESKPSNFIELSGLFNKGV